ncbi:MAG TPA: helix-turn-helix transcriptional regulator, partial [Solirubrobacteraceae bacterium]
MPAEIGATLREARMRARIDISEIEAQTKIRAKYLRALENEEWDLLPGPTFVKSFLRTYAQALDLDDKAIVEEYRQHYERPNEADLQPIVPASRQKNQAGRGGGRGGARGGGSGPSRGYAIAIGVVSLLIVLLVVALLTGGSSNNNKPPTTPARNATVPHHHTHHTSTPSAGSTPAGSQSSVVALSVQPTAPVYVCLISAGGRKLIPGLILQPGSAPSTYHSKSFTITLGNNSVKLFIDGSLRTVPSSSQAIGYAIDQT